MRIIAVQTLKEYCKAFPKAKQALLSWYDEVEAAHWNNPNELKELYRNPSVITSKRILFDISGNTYRLVVDVEFRLKIVFVVWFGPHKEYDKIDVKTVRYAKASKK